MYLTKIANRNILLRMGDFTPRPLPPMPARVKGLFRIADLRLDLDAANAGKTWLLLPEGFRDQECGLLYPLPSGRNELQKLAAIPIPLAKQDCGVIYLRRALKAFNGRQAKRQSATLDIAYKGRQAENVVRKVQVLAKELRAEARAAVEEVKQEAQKAVANLNDLFALGREGIDGQMKAHLAGENWHDEKVDAAAFRECFRMVTQAVKGLGLPSGQRDKAREAVMEEIAKSLEDTREAVALAPGGDEEKPN